MHVEPQLSMATQSLTAGAGTVVAAARARREAGRVHASARCMVVVVLVLFCMGVALPAAGQSLGEVARREAERRKTVKAPVRVYTNDSLQPTSEAPPPPPAATPAAEPASGGKPDAAQAAAAAPAAPDPKKDPEYWRKRITDARTQRDRNAFLMTALQTRIDSLWADFTARDDPAQRSIIGSERDRAVAELERMKKDQADFDKQIADIEEEARRANVPPGWIR
ncbi:MAG: hypothetical protein NTY02_17630 [Acidobacteria bacterium]|nr:hypothetical protein [Acidobacteriota bacterium]